MDICKFLFAWDEIVGNACFGSFVLDDNTSDQLLAKRFGNTCIDAFGIGTKLGSIAILIWFALQIFVGCLFLTEIFLLDEFYKRDNIETILLNW